jgi:hypothetical protein
MSKAEILDELSRLSAAERREILERICDLEDSELTAREIAFLEERFTESRRDPGAWSSWEKAKPRIISRLPKS